MMGFEEQIKKHAKSYRYIAEECLDEDDYKDELAVLSCSPVWVRVEDAVDVHRLHRKNLLKLFKTRPKPSDFKGTIEDRMKEYIIAMQFWLLDVEGLLKK